MTRIWVNEFVVPMERFLVEQHYRARGCEHVRAAKWCMVSHTPDGSGSEIYVLVRYRQDEVALSELCKVHKMGAARECITMWRGPRKMESTLMDSWQRTIEEEERRKMEAEGRIRYARKEAAGE